jgi:hypothetical protein
MQSDPAVEADNVTVFRSNHTRPRFRLIEFQWTRLCDLNHQITPFLPSLPPQLVWIIVDLEMVRHVRIDWRPACGYCYSHVATGLIVQLIGSMLNSFTNVAVICDGIDPSRTDIGGRKFTAHIRLSGFSVFINDFDTSLGY